MANSDLPAQLLRHGVTQADLETLADADLQRLEALFTAARTTQSAQLRSAMEQSLEYVPRVLRGQIRKLLQS